MRRGATVLLMASGTRGDVEPLAVLARAMATRGMTAVIAAHEPYRGIVDHASIRFEALPENPSTFLAELETDLAAAHSPLVALNAWLRYLRQGREAYEAIADRAAGLARHADALILGLPSFWLYPIALHRRIPVICCPLQPLTPTREFPCAWLGWRTGWGPANAATHALGAQMIWQPWRGTITRWARHALPGTAIGFLGPLRSMLRRDVPFVYGFSPHVVRRPADWPPNHVLSGFWMTQQTGEALPERVQRFLDAPGGRVVCVTMGSMDYRLAPFAERMQRVIRGLGLRAVIQSRHLSPSRSDDALCVIDGPVSHSTLFPRAAAVIHHGGAGTLARAIAAGKPSLALTGTSDSVFWGEQANAAGVSPRPLPVRQATTEALRSSIERLVGSRSLRARAESIGALIRAENGPETAAGIIAETLGID